MSKRFYILLAWVTIMPFIGSVTISGLMYGFEMEFPIVPLYIYFIGSLVAALVIALALCPTTVVAMLSGLYLGWWALPFVVLSYLMAAFIGYYLFGSLDHASLQKYMTTKPKMKKFFDRLQNRQFKLVVFSRLSPVLPFSVMNMVLASLSVNIKTFLLGSLIGMLPRTLLSVYLGIVTANVLLTDGANYVELIKLGTTALLFLGSSYGLKRVIFND